MIVSPLLSRLDNAVAQLTSLQAELALGVGVSQEALLSAYEALRGADDAVLQGEMEEIGLTLESEPRLVTAARMTSHLGPLREIAGQMRGGTRSLFAEQDALALRQIVGETRPALSGALAKREIAMQSFRIPEWACQLQLCRVYDEKHLSPEEFDYPIFLTSSGTAIVGSNHEKGATSELKLDLIAPRHFEIRFTANGRFWIRNIQSDFITTLNAQPLVKDRWYPLEGEALIGFQLEKDSQANVFRIKLPHRDSLEKRREDIAAAPSFEALIKILKSEERHDLAGAVRVIALEGIGIGNVSETAGLARRVRQLAAARDCRALEKTFESLHKRYFGSLSLDIALPHYRRLTQTLQEAKTEAHVLDALRQSLVPNMSPLIATTVRFFDGDGDAYSEIPTDFGLRAKVRELAMSRSKTRLKGLEAFEMSADDFLKRPWNDIRVSPALKLALSALRRDGDKQRDFKAFQDVIEAWNEKPTAYLHLSDEEKELNVLETEEGGWRYTGDLFPASPLTGHVTLSLAAGAEDKVWKGFTLVAEAAVASGVSIQFRMPVAPAGGETTVAHFYFSPKDQKGAYDLLAKFGTKHAALFAPREGPFTLPVFEPGTGPNRKELPGIRFAQTLGGRVLDERASALRKGARFVEFLQKGGPPLNWNAIYQVLAFFLDRAGVDISRPALIRDRRQDYALFLELSGNKKP